MADWYVSSVNYAAVPQWAANTAYTVGQFIRALATPSQPYAYWVYRCTAAGTSGTTEPSWDGSNNAPTISGGATFTNVAGQSAYGWSAAVGNIYSLSYQGVPRAFAGDRIFVASDHSETLINPDYAFAGGGGFGSVQVISVNRAGSVPPVTADQQSGAAINVVTGTLALEASVPTYWQGIVFTAAGNVNFNSGFIKTGYFKNCAFVLTAASVVKVTNNNPAKVVWDNTTVQFGHVGQGIQGNYSFDFTWINTPSAIQGATVPTTLFSTNGYGTTLVTCRGVDLSALTTTLAAESTSSPGNMKVLLDSCRINPSVTRFAAPSISGPASDEVELVNCYDGTNVINERYSAAGNLTIDRSTTLSGGAQDDIGLYSLKLISNANSDKRVLSLDSFALDVENAVIGASKTATVEVLSSASLNNDDIQLMLEYMGTSGSPIASFGNSQATVLTAVAALPTSSATWSLPLVTWNPADKGTANTILSNGNLTYGAGSSNTSNDGCRSIQGLTAAKFYFELAAAGASSTVMLGVGLLSSVFNVILSGSGGAFAVFTTNGHIWNNNSDTTITIGTPTAGTVYCYAIDLVNKRGWIRKDGGNWNNNATYDPATNVGGIDISWLGSAAVYALIASNVNANPIVTANFGASAFAQTVPSGFMAGWSPSTKQKLAVPFTPQRAGRVRGLVRLGKVSTTVWVNPQLAIA